MAGSVNKVILIGNLGSDPEVRTFENGNKVCNLSIATSDTWKDKDTGERQERTEWHRVVIHVQGLVGIAEQYLRKGSKVYIEGQLKTRKWQDQETGKDRYSTEVVLQPYYSSLQMLSPRSESGSHADGGGGYGGGQAGGQTDGYGYGDGSQAAGNQVGGNQAGGDQAAGNQVGGNQTGGDQVGGDQTDGGQSGDGNYASGGINDNEIPF